MPQLDFTTYSSQIFWFVLCFITLYFFASKIILPRIKAILEERKDAINSNLSKTANLNKKVEEINANIDEMKHGANQKYQLKIEEALKAAKKEREKSIEDLKNNLDSMAEKSRQEIKNFIEKSKDKKESSIQALVELIKGKILS